MIRNKVLEDNSDDDAIIDLYHLNIFNKKKYFKDNFGDVKIVCMGGKASRMRQLAIAWKQTIEGELSDNLHDYSIAGDRFSMYKENKVIFLNHGMGIPSISIALNEVTKLLHFAGVTGAIYIRIGTCGGLGLEPGTFVVTENVYDTQLNNYHEMFICGKSVKRPAILDKTLGDEFIKSSRDFCSELDEFKIMKANTFCANDFYEEQARFDGAFNDINIEEKQAFFDLLQNKYNIKNIEMESLGFAAFCHNLKIKGLVVAMVLIDRMVSDSVSLSGESSISHQNTMNKMLINYFKDRLSL